MKSILEFTKQLVEIPSESGKKEQVEKILAIVKSELSDFSMQEFAENDHPSLLITNNPDTKHFKIILNAHIDVVPAKEEQYTPVEKDGKLFGRGTYDMKSGAAGMILVFKELAKKLPYDIALQVVTDEELGGDDGVGLQLQKGITADFVMTGEPSNFRIVHKAKGIYRIKITAIGKTAHGAYPWKGINAIAKINDFLNTLWKIFPIPENAVWESTINVASISTTNTAYNKIPDDCTLFLDVRYIPEEKETILEKVKSLVPDDMLCEVVLHGSSVFVSEENNYVQTLAKIITDKRKKNPEIDGAHGASDLHHYDMYKIPGIEFGPLGAGHHSDEEWVDIQSLTDYYEILKAFLLHI